MTINLECPSCGKQIKTKDSNAGKRAKCPQCSSTIEIPAGSDDDMIEEEDSELAPLPEDDAFSPVALGLAVGAAALGTIAWAGILYAMQVQIGWLAWGIGGLVGLATVKGGGRGIPMAVTAAALALLSIASGTYVGSMMLFDQGVEQGIEEYISSPEVRTAYRELQSDSEAWNELGGSASDEVLSEFMYARRFTDAAAPEDVAGEELEYFREEVAPDLVEFHANQPSFDEYVQETVEAVREYADQESDLMALIIEDLGAFDLLFAGLGIMTAWGMVMKASATRHTAAIRASRRRRRR